MKIAVVGSRSFNDYGFLTEILSEHGPKTAIISGGARGADSLARRYAEEHNIPFQEFLPDWDQFGKSAGPRRNQQIVDAADIVIAFWDGRSRGTGNTLDLAAKSGKQVHVCWPRV